MKRDEDNYISMKSISGPAKMCCLASHEFRNDVIILARKHGKNLQEFMLTLLRDKVAEQRRGARTLQGRRTIALERLFVNKRTSQELKDIVDQALKKYMPD